MHHAMPPQLLQEVLRVAQTDAPDYQNVVIDICAGDRRLSLLQPTQQAGPKLHYVGVDIRFDKSLRC